MLSRIGIGRIIVKAEFTLSADHEAIVQALKEIRKDLKIITSPLDYYMGIKKLSVYSGISERKIRGLLHHAMYPLPAYK